MFYSKWIQTPAAVFILWRREGKWAELSSLGATRDYGSLGGLLTRTTTPIIPCHSYRAQPCPSISSVFSAERKCLRKPESTVRTVKTQVRILIAWFKPTEIWLGGGYSCKLFFFGGGCCPQILNIPYQLGRLHMLSLGSMRPCVEWILHLHMSQFSYPEDLHLFWIKQTRLFALASV